MDVELFDYSSIVDREPIEWPDGARVAFYVGLNAESADSGRVMALALHPFVIGQAFRLKYLDQALKYIAGHEGVWLTTSDKIAAHYARAGAPGSAVGAKGDSLAGEGTTVVCWRPL